MKLLARDLSTSEIYRLLTGMIVPRPIAWVTTLSPGNIVNAAPFSCFTFVGAGTRIAPKHTVT
jgi:flavin reductase (DIM6/NTAB) family NADH-FMN oxidoreductase RutF